MHFGEMDDALAQPNNHRVVSAIPLDVIPAFVPGTFRGTVLEQVPATGLPLRKPAPAKAGGGGPKMTLRGRPPDDSLIVGHRLWVQPMRPWVRCR
jgi:hypothetical protein